VRGLVLDFACLVDCFIIGMVRRHIGPDEQDAIKRHSNPVNPVRNCLHIRAFVVCFKWYVQNQRASGVFRFMAGAAIVSSEI